MPLPDLNPNSGLSMVRACTVTALVAILVQFTLAGLALFVSPSLWSAHIAAGGFIALPLTALLVLTRQRSTHAGLARPARWLAALYVLQVLLAAADGPGLDALRALHVGNAALVLVAAWQLAMRALKTHTGTSSYAVRRGSTELVSEDHASSSNGVGR